MEALNPLPLPPEVYIHILGPKLFQCSIYNKFEGEIYKDERS